MSQNYHSDNVLFPQCIVLSKACMLLLKMFAVVNSEHHMYVMPTVALITDATAKTV